MQSFLNVAIQITVLLWSNQTEILSEHKAKPFWLREQPLKKILWVLFKQRENEHVAEMNFLTVGKGTSEICQQQLQ